MAAQKIPFLAQGGGHGFSPTLGSIQDAVLIKLQNLNKTEVKADNTVVVGGGARFGDVYKAVHAKGRELSTFSPDPSHRINTHHIAALGSCPCVGATGATLGGGIGRLQGIHGLASDAVQKVRLALWDGSVVEASATKNTELFWGLRGAGQNFGVVIESTFKTYPQTNKGYHYNADMLFTDESVEGVLQTINSLIPDLDPALAIDLFFFADPVTLKVRF